MIVSVGTGSDLVSRESLFALLDRVSAHDGIEIPVGETDLEPGPQQAAIYLVRKADQLIGAAVVMRFDEPEAMIFVDPDSRRQGVGRALVETIREGMRERAEPEGLLIADLAGSSAKPFLTAIDIPFVFAEYGMEIRHSPIDEPLPIEDLHFRLATDEDRTTLIAVQMVAFDRPEQDATEHIDRGLAETKRFFVLAEVQGEAIGMVRQGEWDGRGDITSLGVVPAWRRRGIGRALLIRATRELFASGYDRVALEVETENPAALNLYTSVGFQVQAQFGYYRLLAD